MFCIITRSISTLEVSTLLEHLISPASGLRENIHRNGFVFKGLTATQVKDLSEYLETQSVQGFDITDSSIRVVPAYLLNNELELENALTHFKAVIEELFRSSQFSFVLETGFCLDGLDSELQNQIQPQLQALGATITIEDSPLPESPILESSHKVSGYIFFDDGTPATGLAIRLVDKKFGGAGTILAGNEYVEADGSYTFSYTPDTLPINIEVVAIASNSGPEVSLCKTILNAGENLALNLVAPAKTTIKTENGEEEVTLRQAPAPEFQSLTTDLSQQMPRIERIAEAKETEDQCDLSVLHQTTGWDSRLIGLTAKAYQNVQPVNLLPDEERQDAGAEVLYALYRTGLPFDTEKLALVEPEVVNKALDQAQTAGLIQLNDTQIETAKQKFKEFSHNTRLTLKVPGTVSTVEQLLDQTSLDNSERQKFSDVYFAPQQDDTDFWQQVKAKGISEEKIPQLQLQGKLAYLTLNNAKLTASLQSEIGSLEKLPALVEKGFHQPQAWINNIQNLAAGSEDELNQLIPPNYIGNTPLDRLQAYAEDQARQVSLSFPNQVVQHMLNTNQKLTLLAPKDADTARLKQIIKRVSDFLEAAAPLGYEIGRTPLDPFVDKNTAALKTALSLTESDQNTAEFDTILNAVRQCHCLYQLTPSDNALEQLILARFTSAHDVVAYTRQQFVDRFKNTNLSTTEAELIYRKAQQITSVTENMIALANQLDTTPPIHALSGTPDKREKAKKDLIKRFPGLNSLVNSLDYCECKHCRSVLSPAAYLVDLLQFIEPKDDVWEKSFKEQWTQRHAGTAYQHPKPFDVLTERRPDIPHIELTCENTHTALPYIDVVNEIFEYYVANQTLALTADETAVRNTVDESTADLLAEPQYVIGQAYNTLSTAKYPLTLPFDLWLETVRQFFNHFELPLATVLKTFHTTNSPYNQLAIYTEKLGISPSEYALLTRSDGSQWYQLYCYETTAEISPDAIAQTLRSAKTLSQRLGISYKELVELIKTEFINPYLKLTKSIDLDLEDSQEDPSKILYLADPDAGCSFEKTIVQYANRQPAKADVFLKLNLFVRLWKKLDWSISDLDRAFTTFAPSGASSDTPPPVADTFKAVLTGIAHIKTLNEKLELGAGHHQSLLTLFGNMPTRGNDSLYVQRFLRPSITEGNNIFAAENGHYLPVPNIKLGDEKHLLSLQGALRLTASELEDIFKDSNLNQESDLTLKNISLLYRYAFLAKALKLSIKDLISLKVLSGINLFQPSNVQPVNGLTPQKSPQIEFIEVVQQVQATDFKLTELDYLLRHKSPDSYQPNLEALATFRKNLIAEIKRIRTAYALPDDASTFSDDLIQQHLAMVMPPDVVDTFMSMWTKSNTGIASQSNFAQDSKAFFEKYLQKTESGIGLFESDEYDVLFAINDSDQPSLLTKRQRLAERLIPYLQENLSRQAIIQLFASELDAEAEIVETLLTDKNLLSLQVGKTLLASLIEIQLMGVNASYYRSEYIFEGAIEQKQLQTIHTTSQEKQGHTPDQPSDVHSIQFEGALEVPTTGIYRFYATAAKAGIQINLTIDLPDQQETQLGEGQPEANNKPEDFIGSMAIGTQDNQTFDQAIKLESGKTYTYELSVNHINSADFTLEVQNQALPRGPLSRLTLYPKTVLETIETVYLQLSKAVQLISGFALTPSEIRYFSQLADPYGQLNLSQLPIKEAQNSAAQELFNGFLRIARYHQLKQEVNEDSDILIQKVFQEPTSDKWHQALAEITGRDKTVIESVARHFNMSATDPSADNSTVNEQNLWQIWQALKTVNQLGVSADALIDWLNIVNPTEQAQKRQEIIENLRNTLKSRYDTADWQRVAQAIFDPLRQKKRDALVAYILHKDNFERPEELFEYFLIDPGMEPVVQTSRIKLAISSVQLFIQRCFLNLEPKVHPSALDSEHWQWMKRYRVWEANRKIFLYPENWLEPEFRADKSPLFQELESALLQGDVSNGLAEDAFYNYLKGLEEIARLELVSMYLEENEEDNILHVIGRVYNQSKYFYRRLVHGTWTPWEPITANVEGAHVAVVVWKGVLHLFWVRFSPQPGQKDGSSKNKDKKIRDIEFKDLDDNLQNYQKIELMYSENINRTWSPAKTFSFEKEILHPVPEKFDAEKSIFIHVKVDKDEILTILLEGVYSVSYISSARDDGGRTFSTEMNKGRLIYRLTDKHSVPRITITHPENPPKIPYAESQEKVLKSSATHHSGRRNLRVSLLQKLILSRPTSYADNQYSLLLTSELKPFSKDKLESLLEPFFYMDDKRTFFVRPSLTEETITEYKEFGVETTRKLPQGSVIDGIPKVENHVQEQLRNSTLVPRDLTFPYSRRKIQPSQDWMLNPGVGIKYNETTILSKEGSLPNIFNLQKELALDTSVVMLDPEVIPGKNVPPQLFDLQQ